MGFGERLKIAREAIGLSQRDLAGILGISVNSIANYERGTSFPKESYLYRIINVLEVEPNYLFQNISSTDEMSVFSEKELLEDYRSLSSEGKSFVSYTAAREAEKKLLFSIATRQFRDRYITFDSKKMLCRSVTAKPTLNKLAKMTRGSIKPDYYIMILENELRPLFSEGDVLGIKYAQQIDEKQLGIYDIDGHVGVAVRRKGVLKVVKGKEISTESETPTLYGRVIEVIRNEKEIYE